MRLRYAAALLVVVSALSSAAASAEPTAPSPYRDAKRSVDARVADLLGRMTPAEKVAQLQGDRDMKRVVEPGKFDIMVGASSADIRQRATLEVAKK
jgi:hypothetical protein